MFNFLFDFFQVYQPKPVIFSFGLISFRWYGLCLVLAIFLGLKLSFFWARKYKIFQEKFWSLGFWLILLGIFGARLYHFFSEFDYYQNRPWQFFFIWQGGLGFYGSFILCFIFLFFWAKKNKVPLSTLLDSAAPSLVLGEVFVRLGNYFNQEIFGCFNHFLYQILASLVLFIILMFLSQRLAEKIKNSQLFFSGQIFCFYLIFASLIRFFLEFLRVDFQPIIFSLRLGQVVSFVLFLAGLIGLIYIKTKSKLN